MSDLFITALSMSISGAIMIVVILLICRLLKNSLSKRWQYYIWLVVVIRLLIPFSPEASIIGAVFGGESPVIIRYMAETPTTSGRGDATEPATQEVNPGLAGLPVISGEPITPIDPDRTFPLENILNVMPDFLWVVWLLVALVLLVRKITVYQSFVKYVKAGKAEVSDIDMLNLFGDICEQQGVKRPIELYINPLISSPILMGLFKKSIVLPSMPTGELEFRYICQHELIHYKRGDILYKWLLQITLCLHWFNPLVHFMVMVANRACELSCDEAFIRTRDTVERMTYGDILLESLKTPGEYREGIATLTLCENASQIMERLAAIKKFRKGTTGTIVMAAALSIVMFVESYALGAYSPDSPIIPLETQNDDIESSNTFVTPQQDTLQYNNDLDDLDWPNDRVTIISNGFEHMPYEHFLYGASLTDNGVMSASGTIPPFAEILVNQPEIQYNNDFQILIDGRYATPEATIQYTLYNDKLERIFHGGAADFIFPDEAGIYLLSVEADWRRGEEYSSMAYIFKIGRTDELPAITSEEIPGMRVFFEGELIDYIGVDEYMKWLERTPVAEQTLNRLIDDFGITSEMLMDILP